MAIKDEKARKEEKSVKTSDGLDLMLETRVHVLQRDLATQWPSTDPRAESIQGFQDHLTNLLNEGWKIEEARFLDARKAGEGLSETVFPVILLLIR